MSDDFKIAEANSFQKAICRPEFRKIYQKVADYVYPQLKRNPYFGQNIKKLKGSLCATYRYRIGDYRLFYTIDSGKVLVIMISISHRQDAYR